MDARVAMLIVVGGAALLGVGCAGNTDAPTNVGAHSAQLNGHGQADNGAAFSYFEYWKTANPANKLKTATRNWPAGAQGAISERPQHLSPSTAYSYRLCGNDQGKNPVCANIRQFNTGVARSRLDYNASTDTWQFQDDPGVNSNMAALRNCNFLGFCDTVFGEHYLCGGSSSGLTCGSQIVAPGSCQVGGDTEQNNAVCVASDSVVVKLGDLDDQASVQGWHDGATIDGGSGDDSIYAIGAITLTGGPGRDTLTTEQGNDTINARSATFLNPDTDASIQCGFGDDTVIADRSDPISAGENGCEHVSKP
jgi:hypothetical protein